MEDISKEDRQLAKAVNFGLLYGQSAKGLVLFHRIEFAQYCGLNERHIGRWRRRGFTAFHEECGRYVRRGMSVAG